MRLTFYVTLCLVCAMTNAYATFNTWDFNRLCLEPPHELEVTLQSCDTAIRIHQRYTSAGSPTEEKDLRLANLHLARANALFFSGKINASITDYRHVIDLNDWRASAHGGLGRSLYIQRKDTLAQPSLDLAIALSPGYALAYRYRGLAALRAGNTRKAITDLSTSMDLQPFVSENHVMLGIALFMHGNLPEAKRAFGDAEDLQLAWDYLPVWQYLASDRQAPAQQSLAQEIAKTEEQWPEPLFSALLNQSAMYALENTLNATTSGHSLSEDQRVAVRFYALLFHRANNTMDDSFVNREITIATDIDLTIERQLLPALLRGVLPVE